VSEGNPPAGTEGEPDIVWETSSATPAEAAAVTAVLTAALAASADDERIVGRTPSEWERSARAVRRTVRRSDGTWTSFEG
jgi:hypothetical protein